MTPLVFTVDGPPQGKQRPRLGKGGNIYTPAETRAYERRVKVLALQAVRSHESWPMATSLLVRVTLRFFFENSRRHDADNVAKAILDAGNEVVWKDDDQVAELHVYKCLDAEKPRVEVSVELGAF